MTDRLRIETLLNNAIRLDYRFDGIGPECEALLIHLSQKLELIRSGKLALALTDIETAVLGRLIVDRLMRKS